MGEDNGPLDKGVDIMERYCSGCNGLLMEKQVVCQECGRRNPVETPESIVFGSPHKVYDDDHKYYRPWKYEDKKRDRDMIKSSDHEQERINESISAPNVNSEIITESQSINEFPDDTSHEKSNKINNYKSKTQFHQRNNEVTPISYYCSECKADITQKEYEYSLKKYDKGLCRRHQNTSRLQSTGLTKHQSRYKEGMIKGRIAEALIEELFLALNYNVFRYGMENTVPGIMELLKGVRSDVADNIRRMPDFVIQKRDKKEVFFIEVKFRANEMFNISNLDNDYPYENCYFIVVSKKHIKCITYSELKNGGEITPRTRNYLGNRKEFDLDKDVIIDFCNFAIKFFKKV